MSRRWLARRDRAATVAVSAVTSTLDEWMFSLASAVPVNAAVLVTDHTETPLTIVHDGQTTTVLVTARDLGHESPTLRGRIDAVVDGQPHRLTIGDSVSVPRQSPLADDNGAVASVRVTRSTAGAVVTWRWIAGPNQTMAGTEPVRWGGLDSLEADRTSAQVRADTVAATSQALTETQVNHLVTSQTWEAGRIVLAPADLARAAEALAAWAPDSSWHIESTDTSITVFQSIVSPGRSIHHARSSATHIEAREPRLWPSPDATLQIGSAAVPIHSASRRRSVQTPPLPIDGLWTWVDSNDPDWQRDREAASTGAAAPTTAENSTVAARFDDHDELRHSMRSAFEFAPWLRHLVLVTAGQIPDWLDPNHPRIRVVFHEEIFDPEHLPTFNSHAIEAHFHRIKGLADHIIHFNDDVFLGRPVSPAQFFGPTGSAKVFRSPTPIPHTPIDAEDSGFYAARKNNRALMERAFDVTIHHGYLHTTHSLRKDVLTDIAEEFPDEWRRTAGSRFRSVDDIAIASSLHHDVAIMTNRGHDGPLASKYVKAGCASDEATMLDVFLRRNRDVFCLNDTADRDLPPDRQARLMRAFMAAYFPVAAPWERA